MHFAETRGSEVCSDEPLGWSCFERVFLFAISVLVKDLLNGCGKIFGREWFEQKRLNAHCKSLLFGHDVTIKPVQRIIGMSGRMASILCASISPVQLGIV